MEGAPPRTAELRTATEAVQANDINVGEISSTNSLSKVSPTVKLIKFLYQESVNNDM